MKPVFLTVIFGDAGWEAERTVAVVRANKSGKAAELHVLGTSLQVKNSKKCAMRIGI